MCYMQWLCTKAEPPTPVTISALSTCPRNWISPIGISLMIVLSEKWRRIKYLTTIRGRKNRKSIWIKNMGSGLKGKSPPKKQHICWLIFINNFLSSIRTWKLLSLLGICKDYNKKSLRSNPKQWHLFEYLFYGLTYSLGLLKTTLNFNR